MAWTRIICVMGLILCTSACSVKFAYNNVDRLVRWQMSDYLDLNNAQRDLLDTQIEAFMAWHRREHLPEYAVFVESLATQWSDGVSEAQIESLFEQMFIWGEDIQDQGLPAAIMLMQSLTDEQLAALPERLEKSNQEIAEDELGVALDKVQEAWAEDFADGLERFTGRLLKPQREYLSRRATAYQPERVLWADYRRRFQADMMQLLVRRHEPEFDLEFRRLNAARESYYGEEFTRVSDQNIALSREIASYILSNLTEKQSERLKDALLDLARDFQELAAQAQPADAA
ncbi:MAG: DUF6279 family lipoprotein [bacterium]